MLVLALDTSTNQSSVALCADQRVLGECTWYSSSNHSVELLRNIKRLVADCQVELSQVDVIAVATGPGSFNGVRVALATAKSFAFSLKKKLVGVSSLDICAYQQWQWTGPVCAAQEAGRSELYAACYQFVQEQNDEGSEVSYSMRRLSEYLLLTPQHLSTHLQEVASERFGIPGERQLPPLLFCGEIGDASRQSLLAQMQTRCYFANPVQSTRRASTLALLALLRLQSGLEDDPLALEPLYLRRPSITTSTRKQPLLGNNARHSTGPITTEREEGALRH